MKTGNRNRKPKKTALYEYLEKGHGITEEKGKKKFNLKNFRATISDLREEKVKIVTLRTGNKTEYKLAKFV